MENTLRFLEELPAPRRDYARLLQVLRIASKLSVSNVRRPTAGVCPQS